MGSPRFQDDSLTSRVAARSLIGALFNVGDIILFGKYKNKKGRILSFGKDEKGNPTVTIEPIPKGRKQNKTFGLFKIWRAPPEVAEAAQSMTASRVVARFLGKPLVEDDEDE